MIKRSLDAIEGNVIEFHVYLAKSTVSNVPCASALNESVMMGIDIDGFVLSLDDGFTSGYLTRSKLLLS